MFRLPNHFATDYRGSGGSSKVLVQLYIRNINCSKFLLKLYFISSDI
ncbi:IS231-related, transposase (plasmid) [Bacillus anthracis str. A0488]|nr:IS231-related, transposase [Bacillus anthracis str. A0488]EDR85181.1 IS231-related, transposase [Bacillus anthracis str. A0193]EDR90401.1 IS231-related, transposase [Bacillus anthracis str. A0442]EDS94319.1 IS231-related, transposase [Bacillus anthracis str. A0389]EDT16885.1 IS231-related, transposase [Bacillus anthracis str. A0465]